MSSLFTLLTKFLGTKESVKLVSEIVIEENVPIVKFTWGELMKKKDEVGRRVYQEVLKKDVELSRLFMDTRIEEQQNAFMSMLDVVIK